MTDRSGRCTRSIAVLLLLVLASGLGHRQQPARAIETISSSDTVQDCPVTPYLTSAPTGPGTMAIGSDGRPVSFTETWYGNDALWAGLSPATAGRWFAGEAGNKVLWVREIAGRVTVEGRRLDAEAPPLTAWVPDGYGNLGYQASGVTFPTEGCWEVVGKVAERELRFVVAVLPEEMDPLVSGSQPPPGPDVWTSIRRPLRLTELEPGKSCPAVSNNGAWQAYHTAGDGPVYAAGAAGDGSLAYSLASGVEGRGVAKGFWAAGSDYWGPVLIRGRQIDGTETLRFGQDGTDGLTDELHLSGTGEQPSGDGWRVWGLRTFLRAPGCYAVQIDGWNFSTTVVLRGVGPDSAG
jgi:hypothetical protein